MFGRRGSRSVEIDTRSASPHPGRRAPILAHGQIASQTQFLSHRRQTHPQHSNSSRGRNSPLPPKIPFPAEGPSIQPSLALNLDPVPVPNQPTSLYLPTCLNHSPSPQTHPWRGLYQIQAHPHPGRSNTPPVSLQAPWPLAPLAARTRLRTPATRHQPYIKTDPGTNPQLHQKQARVSPRLQLVKHPSLVPGTCHSSA